MTTDPAADDAMRALSSALLGLLDHGTRPPCADGSNAWTDDSAAVRAKVAPQCDACEIHHRCHTFADTARPPITFGIFAGIDYTATTRMAKTA